MNHKMKQIVKYKTQTENKAINTKICLRITVIQVNI